MLRSNIDFIIDKIENVIASIGIEGKQATLPKLSSIQEDDVDSFHGSVRMPRNIK